MKVAKYLAIALLIAAVLASIGWVLRNSIIQRISGSILADYDMAVTDVSLDALATDNATISYLELEHENGMSIVIEDLTLPIGTSTDGIKTFAAESVTIDMPSDRDAEPPALAELIDRVLSMPDALSNTEVLVAELNVAAYPTIRNLRWSSTEGQQELAANLDAVYMAMQIVTDEDAEGVEVRFSVRLTSLKAPEQTLTAKLRRSDDGFRVSGASVLDLPAMGMIATSIAESLGFELAGVEFANGAAIVELTAEVPFDTSQPASVSANLKPVTPFELAYSVKSGVINVVSVRSASPIKLEATYPETQWSIGEAQVSLSMSYEDWDDITVSIANLHCTNGPGCFMNLDVSMDNADLTFATAKRLELAATQDVEFGEDGVRVLIRPHAEIELTGMSVSGTKLSRLNAVLMSAATLDLTESSWSFAADLLDAGIESLALNKDIKFSTPVSLKDLSISDRDQSMSINVEVDAASSELKWDGRIVAFPGFSGDISLHDDEIVADLMTVGLHGDAKIQAEHNLASETGQISINGAALSFDAQKLSGRVSPWTDDWDIAAGTVSADLQLNWQHMDSGWQLDGQSSITMTDLAGAYAESAFGGLSTRIEAKFATETGFAVDPAHIAIDLLEIGLAIEGISADYTLNPNSLSVDVENLRMHAFGGIIQADPFTYALDSERNSLFLRAESIELTDLLTLKEFEAIELTGRISAALPLIIEDGEVSIVDGKLTGEAPGGVIRYKSDMVPEGAGTSGIGLISRALSNFEYESLTSTVSYSKDGDLVLQMRLAGRNPDLEDSRPVVLNLGVENNIRQMLRSLQAARAVEEILERRLSK